MTLTGTPKRKKMTSTPWCDHNVHPALPHLPRRQSIQSRVVMPIIPGCLLCLTVTCPLSAQTQHIPRLVQISTQLRITHPAPSVHERLYIPTDSPTPGKCLPMQTISASVPPTRTNQLTTAALIAQLRPPSSRTDSPSVKTQLICSHLIRHQLFLNQDDQAILMFPPFL